MRVGFDLDEVLADFLNAFIAFNNDKYKTNFRREEFFSYNFWEVYGGTREDAINRVHEFHKTDYFKNICPINGAITSINYLKKKHNLFIITPRQNEIINETKDWVYKYFNDAFSGIYFANHFSKNGQEKTKAEFCNKLNLDFMVEDSFSYAKECVTEKRKVLLLDSPWNKTVDLKNHPGIERVYSLIDIQKNLEKKF